jgi:hypothetical protein
LNLLSSATVERRILLFSNTICLVFFSREIQKSCCFHDIDDAQALSGLG